VRLVPCDEMQEIITLPGDARMGGAGAMAARGGQRDGDADRAATIIYDHVSHVGNAIIEYVRQQEEVNASEEIESSDTAE